MFVYAAHTDNFIQLTDQSVIFEDDLSFPNITTFFYSREVDNTTSGDRKACMHFHW